MTLLKTSSVTVSGGLIFKPGKPIAVVQLAKLLRGHDLSITRKSLTTAQAFLNRNKIYQDTHIPNINFLVPEQVDNQKLFLETVNKDLEKHGFTITFYL